MTSKRWCQSKNREPTCELLWLRDKSLVLFNVMFHNRNSSCSIYHSRKDWQSAAPLRLSLSFARAVHSCACVTVLTHGCVCVCMIQNVNNKKGMCSVFKWVIMCTWSDNVFISKEIKHFYSRAGKHSLFLESIELCHDRQQQQFLISSAIDCNANGSNLSLPR